MLDRTRGDSSVVVSGRAAAEEHGIPAGADRNRLDAYISRSRFEDLCAERIIDLEAATVNTTFHVVDDQAWPFDPSERFVPLLTAWLDLADAADRAEPLVRTALLRQRTGQPPR